ncbi:EamA-like transporter family protein [Cognatiyoonia koreensis]|uniref:EamA-like transporter family protein n=1 Tax=Cognatiyoonia koreensis TaxID=364200 RepID=A0A1I0MZP0_9RHOB|nr:DMT family transporter [Cognatiyoonia koreensis]SEV94232.1 EamA-like transporter family protein [Cognatiyoonia koreensis]
MRIFLLTALTMTAFASNSLLNRIAVANYAMDPMVFAVIRTAAGAAMLTLLVLARRGVPQFGARQFGGAVSLAIYMIGFSWAYLSLGAGLGALILFGVLQVVMFGFAVVKGQDIPALRWAGAVIALVGLAVLLWPSGTDAVPVLGALSMAAAGIAWAAYTLLGQKGPDAVAASAGNFVLCLPLVILPLGAGWGGVLSGGGVALAITAGAVTSGLGYALWYRVLPKIATTTAAVAQLSVPVIAVAAGAVFLAEPLTMRLIVAGGLVLGGIGISLVRR